ncbi:MAG TPA: O-antigen ligase family protein [Anaeromyxobacter sp.]|nr:O-antigen ligase family protein [Anaeromyxobacter sp.]
MAQADAATLDSALLDRQAWIERASRRWHLLLHGATLAFIVMLYSNPQFWWPWFEKFRLAFATMAVGAFALVMHRVTSGERIRLGGPGVFPLLAYLSFVPLSLAWTLSAPDTIAATFEAAKMAVVFVVVQAAVDGPRRLRRFMLVGALAALGPALGAIEVWRTEDALIDGYRTHWRGPYADPNRLAMCLIAVLPFALYGAITARKRWARVLFAAALAVQITAIVLTHSRSGSIAAAVALGLFLFRGGAHTPARRLVAAVVIALGLLTFAPASFWQRQATIASYETDVSVEGRENAWKVLGVIVEERPLTGVGAAAFIQAWGRYAPLEAGGRRYVAHNILLEIVGELGVVAFGLFCAFIAWLLPKLWRVGSDPLVGPEARAIFAALAGYLVIEMVNGYSLSWFLYFLFACGLVTIRLSRARAALGTELPPWATR